MTDPRVLVVNAGSTSLKLDLVDASETSVHLAGLDAVAGTAVDAVAHRIVHGGPRYRDPVLVDTQVERDLESLVELAPLHNRPALDAYRSMRAKLPGVRHVAVFDTGFHATIPEHAAVYAVPSEWREQYGIRRYGFHGLSVQWASERAPELTGRPAGDLRMIVCHLGGGSSVTAVAAGRSVDTTMGFSPLEGVPMTTRSGSVDPGAVVHAMRAGGLGADQVDSILNTHSGIAALAGVGGGMQAVVDAAEAGGRDAQIALDVFTYRVAGAVATMAMAAGGQDELVFTAGIGEHSPQVRERVCRHLAFLGVALDAEANRTARPDTAVSPTDASMAVLVIRAREELIAARCARAVLARA